VTSPSALPALSIFGLGYVGCISAACFASRGHRVVGVDVDPQKLELLQRGEAPIVEERIGDLTAEMVASGRLSVTDDARRAVLDSDATIVCVGTPSSAGGGLSTQYVESVTDEIGVALAEKDGWHVVVYRSTMLPGTCEDLLIPRLEKSSGKTVGVDFGVCVNPEFLREGSSVRDFFDPPKTVVGESDQRSGDLVAQLYDGLPGGCFRVPLGVAEMTQYVDNSFHAIKIDFANEIGALCVSIGLDSHEVMDVFLADAKLNISAAYLRPGFAFGGSCLPKDVRALTHLARRADIEVPLLSNVLSSNEAHLRRAIDVVIGLGRRKVGIFGLAFKAGTDDLRESPLVELVERLIGKGFDVMIYDPNVALSRLLGKNKTHIEQRLPHLAQLLTDDIDVVMRHGDVLVVGTSDERVVSALDETPAGKVVVDLVRVPNASQRRLTDGYIGIGW
jgi:GDP-mannose 6-dehydrogenase